MCTRLVQYNFTVPLRNLNFISTNLVHGPPATPATTMPRVRPISLIFFYKMVFSPSFSYGPLLHHGASFLGALHGLCFHFISSLSSKNWHVQLILSLLVAHAAAFSHQLCHFKLDDWWGDGGLASYVGYPPLCAPGSVGRKLCGVGPPQMGQESSSPSTKTAAMMKTSMGGGKSVGLSDSLLSLAFPSPRRWNWKGRFMTGTLKWVALGQVGFRFRSAGMFCLAFGSLAPGSSGPCGGLWVAAVFPQLTLTPEFA
jgi:hypothetical protein